MTTKDKSEFIDAHGKQAINFQISVFLYAVVLAAITIPLVLFNALGPVNLLDFTELDGMNYNLLNFTPLLLSVFVIILIAVIGFILELVFIVVASLKARDGEFYKYPLTINFLK